MNVLLEIIGWIGSILYILAYFLLSYNIIGKEKLYYLINKIAAFFIVIISYYKSTYQPIFINLIWLYISYLGYHNQNPSIKFFNKKTMYIISYIWIIIVGLMLLINYMYSIELLAWFSVFAFSSSYFLFSIEKLEERTFHFYNLLAAASLIPKVLMYSNYQVFILELIWGFLALLAYIKHSTNKDYITVCS